jgi:DNA-binding transcriptional MocR family regulator|tara:strand:- start:1750 stop:2373 length:624 start_codon:yes stop_codon:yes gene_type:complete
LNVFKEGEFGIFPATILKGLHPCKQTIIAWLIYHTNNKTGVSFPSLQTLSRETGIKSRTTLTSYLSELEKEGYIKKRTRFRDDGGNTSNEYEVFIKRTDPCPNKEQGIVQDMNTNYNKNNQKNINKELFEKCWTAFNRKGTKSKALQYWSKLSEEDRLSIFKAIPKYVSTRERVYQKDFQGWINPTHRMWEDEVFEKEKKVPERIKI